MRIQVFVLLLISTICSNANAYSEFYQKSKRGWYWYEQSETEQSKTEQTKSVEQTKPEQAEPAKNQDKETEGNQTAMEELNEFKEGLEERKATMIMRPSIENTKEYIKYQNEMYRKADRVSQNIREVMLVYPGLNIAREIPISDEGAKIRNRAEKVERAELLKRLAKHFKLLFFYKGNCIFCKNFASVIEVFARRYGYKVASITLDGVSIGQFPARYDKALIERFNVTQVPSVFIYSEELKIASPVMSGYGAIDELESNMFYIARKLKEELRK